jgi:hypothetical protein
MNLSINSTKPLLKFKEAPIYILTNLNKQDLVVKVNPDKIR